MRSLASPLTRLIGESAGASIGLARTEHAQPEYLRAAEFTVLVAS